MCHKSPFILHLKSLYLPFSFHGFPYLQCHLIIFQQDLLPRCPSALPFQSSINATTPSQELLLCHFDVRHLGIQDFFSFRFRQKRKILGFGEWQILISNGNVQSRMGGWRVGEQNLDSCGCGMLGSSGDLPCCWPWGASPGPGEMQALPCFKSVLKKCHPLRLWTKLINECRAQGWVHPWTLTWLVWAARWIRVYWVRSIIWKGFMWFINPKSTGLIIFVFILFLFSELRKTLCVVSHQFRSTVVWEGLPERGECFSLVLTGALPKKLCAAFCTKKM